MDAQDRFDDIVQHRKNHRVAASENYGYQSKRRLQRIIETKIKTTMIGSISAIEAKLGFLWGQGKPVSQLTDKELFFLTLKDELRTEILNNGNNQKRAAVTEIDEYDVEWKRHRFDLHVTERINNKRTEK